MDPWNTSRVFDNFYNIDDNNILSAAKGNINITNSYVYPMNFVMCENGNHSQFAAISKGKGESYFVDGYDFSLLYDSFKFNGSDFVDCNDRIVNLRVRFSSEEIIYAGILFEIGRVRLQEGFMNLCI